MKGTIRGMICAVALATAGGGQAQSGDVLITATPVGNGYDLVVELLNEGGVAAVQYEIQLPASLARESIDVSNCIGSYAGSQLAGCNLTEENIVRVGIINQGLSDMATGEIGRIHIADRSLAVSRIQVQNAALVHKTGKDVKINVLTDFSKMPSRPDTGPMHQEQ